MHLDAATVLLQWAAGGLLFLWFTLRDGEISVGYAKLLRATYGVIAVGSLALGVAFSPVLVRDASAAIVAVCAFATWSGARSRLEVPAFAVAVVGLVADVIVDDTTQPALWIARLVVGAVFLGAVSDAMLLGHWYLVQPGMPRRLLNRLTNVLLVVWPIEIIVMLLPTGMIDVLTGRVDDGWNGVLGWFWLASASLTGVLAWLTRAALKERRYSAVMAATGLSYLAILMGFGTDVIARALLMA
jgi:hypothetical protein